MKALKIIFDYYGQKYMSYAPMDALIDAEGQVMPLSELAENLRRNSYCCDTAKVNIEFCVVYLESERKELEKEIDLWPKYESEPHVFVGTGEVVECEETGIEVYKDTAYVAKLCSTPYDEPEDTYFCNIFAYDCYFGNIYSKDFGYFHCEQCNREICTQNPSNGWHIQYHSSDDGIQVCDKCYQENMLENGIEYSELFRTHELAGSFFNDKELTEAGYEVHEHFNNFLVGHGMSGYNDPNNFWKQLAAHSDLNGRKLIINYEHMAIGGMGGYISLWYK